ncbi:hypothetical protein IV04_02395 [Serratia sp. Ag1]|nr:hypothetical protein JV45_01085 [Serratia sp. Ag2]KFL00311.1 hypothetical protein IV04_02395 [Serratia sp. Ag1]
MTWLFVVFFFIITIRGIKGNRGEFGLVKDWSSRNLWEGKVANAKLISWKQMQAMHNFDYFYIFVVDCDLDGVKKTYNAAGVVKISQAALLKKGQSVTVKYQGIPPKKIAVIEID